MWNLPEILCGSGTVLRAELILVLCAKLTDKLTLTLKLMVSDLVLSSLPI